METVEVKNNVENKNSKVNVPLNEGEFVAWMVEGDPDTTPFMTKKECLEFRNREWAAQYKSVAEMDRLIPAVRYVFAGKSGMEGNVPVCSVEERIRTTRKANNEKGFLTKQEMGRQVLEFFDCGWGEVAVTLLTHPECAERGFITFEGMTITNCPTDIDEIDMDLVEDAIRCYGLMDVWTGFVVFNYPTLEQDIELALASL